MMYIIWIMIENYREIIANLSEKEALEIISKMGMNMTDHPYLSNERKQELKEEEQRELEEYEDKIKNNLKN